MEVRSISHSILLVRGDHCDGGWVYLSIYSACQGRSLRWRLGLSLNLFYLSRTITAMEVRSISQSILLVRGDHCDGGWVYLSIYSTCQGRSLRWRLGLSLNLFYMSGEITAMEVGPNSQSILHVRGDHCDGGWVYLSIYSTCQGRSLRWRLGLPLNLFYLSREITAMGIGSISVIVLV